MPSTKSAYTSEPNPPKEQVWRYAKATGTPLRQGDNLFDRVKSHLSTAAAGPRLVRSFCE